MTAAKNWGKRFELPRNDIEDLYLAKHMFLDIQRLVARNSALQREDYFHTFLLLAYVAHISTLLRRNLSRNSKGYSFLNLLESVAAETKGSKDHVLADIAELEICEKICMDFFDKQVAHIDKKPPSTLPTYNDLHATIDLLTELCGKYSKQLVGEEWCPEPGNVGDGWLTIFDSPWYEP